MLTLRDLARRLWLPPPRVIPVRARHVEYSAVVSADDDPFPPSDQLVDLALRTAQRARTISLEHVSNRMPEPPYYPNVWPGEHYKFLAALIAETRPKAVVEIGTFTGLSSLAMLDQLSEGACLHTFDIAAWDSFPNTCLAADDFENGRLRQILGDVSDPAVMRRHKDLFRSAELLFIDGPKDGLFEQKLIDEFYAFGLPKEPIVVFDDVRLWNMLAIWRGIRKPKLDVTSFGHWSGTGLVHWVD